MNDLLREPRKEGCSLRDIALRIVKERVSGGSARADRLSRVRGIIEKILS